MSEQLIHIESVVQGQVQRTKENRRGLPSNAITKISQNPLNRQCLTYVMRPEIGLSLPFPMSYICQLEHDFVAIPDLL